MTTTTPAPAPVRSPQRPTAAALATPATGRTSARLLVLLVATGVVLLRLVSLNGPLEPDEAGFLTVAAQWHAGGTSLYGDYWVDRPPLLLVLFQIAAALGGAVPLRLIGIIAAVTTVVVVARAAERLAGARGEVVAAVATGAWLVSPLVGSPEVDGELLAAPFVALGISGVVTALITPSRTRALRCSFVAGMAAVAAVLVKQNMVDVVLFAVVVWTVLRTGRLRGAGTVHGPRPAAFLAGATVGAAAVAAWTVAHGTSLHGVWYAMYPFRAAARAVMSAHPSAAASSRAGWLLAAALATGLVAALVVLLVSLRPLGMARRGRHGVRWTVGVALAVVLVYDAVSVYLGGNYWMHYLVQAVVPAGLALAVAAAARPFPAALVAALATVTALGALVATGDRAMPDPGGQVGEAIHEVAKPADSIVTAWGDSDITYASGLRSPYPYLWSLPVRTLDPRLEHLTAVLRGHDAPTWFVSTAGSDAQLSGVDTAGLDRVLARRYREVAHRDDTVVYLLDGVHRSAPRLAPSATTTAIPAIAQESL